MPVTIDWIHVATLVGAIQGFLLAGTLVAHGTNRTANRLLAAAMAAFSVYLMEEVYYAAGLVSSYPQLFGISYPLPWAFGPLIYLYALAASDRTWRFHRRDVLHFVPVAVVVLVGLPTYFMSAAEKVALFERLQAGGAPPLTIRLLDPTKYVSGLWYSAATVAYLRRHRRRVLDTYSTTDRVNLRWLVRLAGAVLAIWLLALGTATLELFPAWLQSRSDPAVALAIAILVYAIGYMGLRQPEIFRYDGPPPSEKPSSIETTVTLQTPSGIPTPDSSPLEQPISQPVELPPTVERYERSGLKDAEASALKRALLELMAREHPYRDPELTLPALAERLETTPHKLSEVLNSELSQTFYDFVNHYRVEDVRRRLAESRSKNVNVLTLAMDAGFASKSTFNQVFKKQTGQTPSTYRKALAG